MSNRMRNILKLNTLLRNSIKNWNNNATKSMVKAAVWLVLSLHKDEHDSRTEMKSGRNN